MKALSKLMGFGVLVLFAAGTVAHAEPRILNRASTDVSVLYAESARIEWDRPVDLSFQDCRPISTQGPQGVLWDCTEAFEWAYGYPSMHAVILGNEDFNRTRRGGGIPCELLKVTTVSASAAVRESAGIGFWYEGPWGAAQRLVPVNRLVQVALTQLRDGREAYLHRFIALANCATSSDRNPTVSFKPYMEFQTSDAIYRNWDSIEGNYRVGPMQKPVDRSREILRFPN